MGTIYETYQKMKVEVKCIFLIASNWQINLTKSLNLMRNWEESLWNLYFGFISYLYEATNLNYTV